MRLLLLLACISISFWANAQLTQTIRGQVQDAESLQAIFGATVVIMGSQPLIGSATDMNGKFSLDSVQVGRVSIEVRALGYEQVIMTDVLLNTGKELQLNVKMNPAFEELKTVEITATKRNAEALNEMATLSSRSFSVEETQRYAASGFDPARMSLAFAGVSMAGDDFSNEISVRGNSPRGILWRLEGIEIPNPNHFADLGSSGGGISMLSSSTLSTSDFYTGAFPSEFGNATSGVFDLNLRNGNSETHEHSVMVGLLGIEASTEGYFKKGSSSSYLINYRYSTLSLLSLVYQPFGDVLPIYQDASFKLNFPETPIGSVSVFALAGANTVEIAAEPDSSLWEENDTDNEAYEQTQDVAVLGLKHVIRLNEKSYVKTVAAQSVNRYTDLSIEHDLNDFSLKQAYDSTVFRDDQFAVHSSLNVKMSNRTSFKSGINFIQRSYQFRYDFRDLGQTQEWSTFINSKGTASQVDQYSQIKHRLTKKLTGNLGYHISYLPFNSTYSIEPRAAISFKPSEGRTLSLAAGLHSKPEHISTYFLNSDLSAGAQGSSNQDLEIPKSMHIVAGYKFPLTEKVMATVETYFQYQYDLPIENLDTSAFATLNSSDIWDIVDRAPLVSQGVARNYGIDLSVQRGFNNGMYYMCNASLYRSEFKTLRNNWNRTRFSGDYVFSLLGGKEYKVGKRGRLFGFNAKILATGGNRSTPFDVVNNEAIAQLDNVFENKVGAYFRADIGFSLKTNKERSTHTLLFDIQNVTNRLNVDGQFYDEDSMETITFYQVGLFPFINYRIEFRGK